MESLAVRRRQLQEEYRRPLLRPRIVVGMGSCGIAAGAGAVREEFARQLAARGLEATLDYTSCLGMCHQEVLVDITFSGGPRVFYGNVTPDMVARLVEEHVAKGEPVPEWAVAQEVKTVSSALTFES